MSDEHVLLIGSEGNMGRRYQAIMRMLDIPYIRLDQNVMDKSGKIQSIIVATPTETHEKVLDQYLGSGIPILCEKPITKNLKNLEKILYKAKGQLEMVNQYWELPFDRDLTGPTYYNYFKHGGDGLGWDCIQLFGLAKGEVILEETSPVWQCVINGQEMSLSEMDYAYVRMIERFTWSGRSAHRLTDEQILSMHEKAAAYVR